MIHVDLILYTIGEYIGDVKEASFNKHALKGSLDSLIHKTLEDKRKKLNKRYVNIYKTISFNDNIQLPFCKLNRWMNAAAAVNYKFFLKKYLKLYLFNWGLHCTDYKNYKAIELFSDNCLIQKFDRSVLTQICMYRAFVYSYYHYIYPEQWNQHYIKLCKDVIRYKITDILPHIVKLWYNQYKTKFPININEFFTYAVKINKPEMVNTVLHSSLVTMNSMQEFESLLFDSLMYGMVEIYEQTVNFLQKQRPQLCKSVNKYSSLYQLLKKKQCK